MGGQGGICPKKGERKPLLYLGGCVPLHPFEGHHEWSRQPRSPRPPWQRSALPPNASPPPRKSFSGLVFSLIAGRLLHFLGGLAGFRSLPYLRRAQHGGCRISLSLPYGRPNSGNAARREACEQPCLQGSGDGGAAGTNFLHLRARQRSSPRLPLLGMGSES